MNNCPWGYEKCESMNHLECLKHKHSKNIKYALQNKELLHIDIWKKTVEHDNIECFKYLYESKLIGDSAIRYIVEKGCIEFLKYFHVNKVSSNYLICYDAAKNGHLDCLRYAHENGCSWNENTTIAAAEKGHFDCLQYAHQNGCKWDVNTILARSIEVGNLECVKYAVKYGAIIIQQTCSFTASEYDHLDILKYLHENNCVTKLAYVGAAIGGSLRCIKYLHENGYEFISHATTKAIIGGHLDCLKYLHENGCEWYFDDKDTKCAFEGHLKCMYSRKRACKWGDYYCDWANKQEQLKCVEYAIDNGLDLEV